MPPNVPPRTRLEARNIGAAFGEEVAAAIARAILDCSEAERTEAYTDGLIDTAHRGMDTAVILYRAAGVPAPVIERFKTAFLRALRDRAGLMRDAATATGLPN